MARIWPPSSTTATVTFHSFWSASAKAASIIRLASSRVSTGLLSILLSPGRSVDCVFDDFDPMAHGGSVGRAQMGLAADIGSDDSIGFAGFQRVQFIVAQLLGQYRLGNRVAAGRAAAQMRIGYRRQAETQLAQDRLHAPAQFLGMLQSTGAVEGQGLG